MRITIRNTLLALIIVFTVICTLAYASERPQRIVVVDDHAYPPFAFVDASGRAKGITIDLWQAWSRQTGIEVEFRLVPLEQALEMVRDGRADAVGGIFHTKERERYFEFTRPLFEIPVGVFFNSKVLSIKGIEDLSGFRVGVVKGDSSEELIRREHPNIHLVAFPGADSLVDAALNGQVNVFVADAPTAQYYLSRSPSGDLFRRAAEDVEVHAQSVAVRKGNIELLDIIRTGFDRLPPQTANAILDRWTGHTTPRALPWRELGILAVCALAVVLAVLAWNMMLRNQVARATAELAERNAEVERSRDAIALAERGYRLTLVSIGDAVVATDRDGRITVFNAAAEQLSGWSSQDAIGRSLPDVLQVFPALPAAISEPVQSDGETVVVSRTGQIRHVSVKAAPVSDETHARLGMVIILRDVTDQREALRALNRSETLSRALFDQAYSMLAVLDTSGQIISANRTFLRLVAKEMDELEGVSFAEAPWWEDRREAQSVLRNALIAVQHGRLYRRVVTLQDSDRVRHAADLSMAPLVDDSGALVHILVEARDLTDLHRAEEALRSEAQLIEHLLRSMPGVFALIDHQLRLVQWNTQLEAATGLSADELGRVPLSSIYHGENEHEIAKDVAEMLADDDEPMRTWEHRIVHASGRTTPYLFTSTRIDSGSDPMLMVFGIDLSERLEMETALRLSEERFRSLASMASEAIAIHVDGVIVECNQALADLVRVPSADELIGRNILYVARLTEESLQRVDEHIRTNSTDTYSIELVRDDGALTPVEVRGVNMRYRGENVRVSYLRDVTELRRAEAERLRLEHQLAESQKMESIGRLAGGVAHDYNNMLSVIIGYTEMLMRRAGEQSPLQRDLRKVYEAARRSADLTRKLLAFARKQVVTPQLLDLNNTIEGMFDMLKPLIGEHIDLVWRPGQGVWPVWFDPSQVDQILANLCVNARDAIGAGGTITIETSNVAIDEAYASTMPGGAAGEYVILAVSDTGCDMDAETQRQIFEPFFTTKPQGEGTGLGLATVYGIVRQNQGFIRVYSEPGHGSIFRIFIPRYVDAASAVELSADSVAEVQGGSETILLVEDEPAILQLGREVLEAYGYTVLAANRPGEAIDLAREHGARVDLLITDVVMPEMNGHDLAYYISALAPHAKHLFMSGYTSDIIHHDSLLESGAHFLPKPFTMHQLLAAVRSVLDRCE